MGNFYTDVLLRSPKFNSPNQVRETYFLEPVTRNAVFNIVNDAYKIMSIEIMITETFRSELRQQMLFRQGLTKLKTVGAHHYGLACDFCKLVNGKASWEGDWSFLRDLAEKYGMINGLDWGLPNIKHDFVDPDHIQRISLAEQSALFSGIWYPSSEIAA